MNIDPTTPLPPVVTGSVLTPIAEQARSAPDRVALTRDGRECRYGELLENVRRQAAGLREAGIEPGDVVAVDGGHSIATVTAVLATMWAGAVVLPFDPAQSAGRRAELLDASGAKLRIVPDGEPEPLPGSTVRTLPATVLEGGAGAAAPLPPDGDAAAYLFFTSGTTGQPRGVLGWHAALAHFCEWERRALGFGPGDRFAQTAALSFDAVLKDILPALGAGAAVCLPPMDRPFLDPDAVLEWLDSERVSVLQTVPSVLAALSGSPRREQVKLSALRLVCLSGEPLPAALVTGWRAQFGDCPARFVNLYGTTEATILKAWFPVPPEPGNGVLPVGRAIDGAQLLVVNRRGRLCGVGEPGEVLIRTPYLTRIPQLAGAPDTEARFVVNPFRPDDPDDLVQATGDLGRYTPDGDVEITGRRDDQVKIRGVRVQPAEVAAVLGRHPGVRAAAVVPRTGDRGEPELVAYLVPRGTQVPPPTEVRAHVTERLSAAAAPAQVVMLERLPLTGHGKLDRAALPDPAPQLGPAPGDTALATATQATLAGIWAEVLDCPPPARNADFFALGGHSLLMVRVLSRVRSRLGADLELAHLFERPVLEDLAALVDDLRARPADDPVAANDPEPDRSAGEPSPFLPLTPAQHGIWLTEQLSPGTGAYNMAGAVELTDDVPPAAVRAALTALLARHESLRMVFVDHEGVPAQHLAPFPVEPDWLVLPDSTDEESALVPLARASSEPFDLAGGRLLRARLTRLPDGRQLLGLTTHHLVCDAISWDRLITELDELLDAAGSSRPSQLSAPRLGFGAYANRAAEPDEATKRAAALDFWTEHLREATILDLPTGRPRPLVRAFHGAVHRVPVPSGLAAALRRFGREHGVTTYMTVLAAAGLVLSRTAYQQDLVLGTDSAGRDREELEDVVGFLVQTHALRLDVSGDPSLADLALRVRRWLLASHPHQHLSIAEVIGAVAPERDPGRNPLFQVVVRLAPAAPESARKRLQPVQSFAARASRQGVNLPAAAKFDLTVVARERGDAIELDLEYDSDVFDPDLIGLLGARLAEVLNHGLTEPATPGSRLGQSPAHPFTLPLPTRERPRVGGRFHEVVAREPDRVAVRQGPTELTYGQLAELSRNVAAAVPAAGTVTAVIGGHHPDSVAALIGTMLAGAVALPLDSNLPEARQRDLALRAGVTDILLATGADPSWPRDLGLPTRSIPSGPSSGNRDLDAAPAGADAYVFFTSGTTGEPKGVIGGHRGLDHFVDWERAEFAITPEDRFAQLTTFSFDAVLRDVFVPLTMGATLCLPPSGTRDDVTRLVRWMSAEAITVVHTTVSMLTTWLAAAGDPQATLGDLRLICLAGEPLSGSVIREFRQAFAQCRAEIVNFYGPTETTMIKTFHRVPATVDPGDGHLPIGRPLPQTQVVVTGVGDRPCGPGERGEVVIRTPYRARYQESSAVGGFVANDWSTDPNDLLYRTGDLAVVRTDGEIVLAGRADGLVKIRGVRVHPAEVAASITALPDVSVAHVEADRQNGRTRLVAYVVAGTAVTGPGLREELAHRLPGSMVPELVFRVDRLPLQPNGKVDRRALLGLAPQIAQRPDRTAPRTEQERALARIWADVIGLEQVGAEADFFAVGGHSLTATIMITRVRKELGVSLSLRDLLLTPTLAALAALIQHRQGQADFADGAEGAERSTVMVTMRPGIDPDPLFLVHPIGGDVLGYRELAGRLRPGRAVYALRSPVLETTAGQRLPKADLRELAATYLHEIRRVQPQGPYHLGGWSLGGVVAYEIARQLSFDGERTATLVLLDSPLPGPGVDPVAAEDGQDDLRSFRADLQHLLGEPPEITEEALTAPDGGAGAGVDLRSRFAVFRAHRQALRDYRLRRSALRGTRILMIEAGVRPDGDPASPAATWAQALGSTVERVVVEDADHYTLVSTQAGPTALAIDDALSGSGVSPS